MAVYDTSKCSVIVDRNMTDVQLAQLVIAMISQKERPM